MNRKYILIIFIALLIPLSSYFIYRYAIKLKSEDNNSTYKNISESNSHSVHNNTNENNNLGKKDLSKENDSQIYCIPNVEIKSLLYNKYDEKDKSKKIIEIKIDYLVIENENNLESISKLNNYLKQEAEKILNSIRQELSDFMQDDYEYSPETHYQYVYTDESKIKKNNKNGIISVSSWSYEDRGAAYPLYISQSYVVDCINGKKLSIFDVIKGNKNNIIDMIKKETIKNMLKMDNTISEEELKDNLYIDDKSNEDWESQSFYLDDNCLVIEFSRCDIAPAVWGMISVDIPYDVIKKHGLDIDPKFIIP